MRTLRILHRENSLVLILRRLARLVPRMQWHDAERAAVVNPHSRHRPVVNGSAKTKARRRPHPAVDRRENPAAIVIRQPTPGCGSDKRVAEKWVLIPAAIAEWRPAKAHSEWPPAISVAAHRIPRT